MLQKFPDTIMVNISSHYKHIYILNRHSSVTLDRNASDHIKALFEALPL